MKHFSWHKHINKRTKQPGFLSIDTPLHYFVQSEDLRHVTKNWKNMEEFQNFILAFPASSSYTIDEFVSTFFKRAHYWGLRCMNGGLGFRDEA